MRNCRRRKFYFTPSRNRKSLRLASFIDGQQFRGYYSALLVREGDAVKIFEETVNVAAS